MSESLKLSVGEPFGDDLTSYQINALNKIDNARQQGIDRGYINWATGLGKTKKVAATDVKNYLEANPSDRVLFLCHRSNILEEASQAFSEVIGQHEKGHMFGDEFTDRGQVVYASFQAMNRKLGGGKVYEAFDPKEFNYVVVDESHHGPARTYKEVIDYFNPGFLLGLTATPERRDQKDISQIFGPELDTILLEEAIAKGWLTRPEYHVMTDNVRQLDIKSLEGKSLSAINRMLFVPKRDEEIVEAIKYESSKITNPRRLIFCPSIAYAEYFAGMLDGDSETIHSKQDKATQAKNLKDFRQGKTSTLLAVDMLNEGIDIPDVNMVFFLRSTESRAVYLQQVGRGLRRYPGKDKVLLFDFVASWERLNTLRKLEADIKAYSHQNLTDRDNNLTPQFVDTEFDFNFSPEAIKAIETIQFARGNKIRPSKVDAPKPRIERQSKIEQKIMDMLGLSNLPNQKMTARDWQYYDTKLKSGDSSVREEVFLRSLRHIYGTVDTYIKTHDVVGLTLEDLFQESCEKVFMAIEKYDPENNKKKLKDVILLATWSTLNNYKLSGELIKLPSTYYSDQKFIENKRKEFVETYGYYEADRVTDDEILFYYFEDLKKLELYKKLGGMSYDNLLDDSAIIDQPAEDLPIEEIYEQNLIKELLYRIIGVLSEREQGILKSNFGLEGNDEKNFTQIAEVYGLNRNRVCQLVNISLKKLNLLSHTQDVQNLRDMVYGTDYVGYEHYNNSDAGDYLEIIAKRKAIVMSSVLGVLGKHELDPYYINTKHLIPELRYRNLGLVRDRPNTDTLLYGNEDYILKKVLGVSNTDSQSNDYSRFCTSLLSSLSRLAASYQSNQVRFTKQDIHKMYSKGWHHHSYYGHINKIFSELEKQQVIEKVSKDYNGEPIYMLTSI